MLQWMGGSRRKVTTSRKSTQNRQKQYFEQRKRRQQLSSGSENWHDAADTGREQKEHRSLDIISLLNLSTIPQKDKDAIEANTSTVRSHFMKDPVSTLYNIETLEKSGDFENKQQIDETGAPFGYPEDTLSPMNRNVSNDPNNGNTAKNKVDSQSEQGKISVEQSKPWQNSLNSCYFPSFFLLHWALLKLTLELFIIRAAMVFLYLICLGMMEWLLNTKEVL